MVRKTHLAMDPKWLLSPVFHGMAYPERGPHLKPDIKDPPGSAPDLASCKLFCLALLVMSRKTHCPTTILGSLATPSLLNILLALRDVLLSFRLLLYIFYLP